MVAGLVMRRRWGLLRGPSASLLFTAESIACPLTGHHHFGTWWYTQMACTLASLVGISLFALRRLLGAQPGVVTGSSVASSSSLSACTVSGNAGGTPPRPSSAASSALSSAPCIAPSAGDVPRAGSAALRSRRSPRAPHRPSPRGGLATDERLVGADLSTRPTAAGSSAAVCSAPDSEELAVVSTPAGSSETSGFERRFAKWDAAMLPSTADADADPTSAWRRSWPTPHRRDGPAPPT